MKTLALILLLATPTAALAATPLHQRPASQDKWLQKLTVPYAPLKAVMEDAASTLPSRCEAYEKAKALLRKNRKMGSQGDYTVLWSDGNYRSVGIDNDYRRIQREVNKYKTQCEHYAEVQMTKRHAKMVQDRPFANTVSGFTYFLNNRVNWDNRLATIQFEQLGQCEFDSPWTVTCTSGYITIKSRVESKLCYLKQIQWRRDTKRTTYNLGQCTYTY